jgi:hypothetical protein
MVARSLEEEIQVQILRIGKIMADFGELFSLYMILIPFYVHEQDRR